MNKSEDFKAQLMAKKLAESRDDFDQAGEYYKEVKLKINSREISNDTECCLYIDTLPISSLMKVRIALKVGLTTASILL